uniref:Uncharacterized protein n=1 Tax=Arundo donax TaxID=35708 RepID=A0A0A8YY43_ARUDO
MDKSNPDDLISRIWFGLGSQVVGIRLVGSQVMGSPGELW